MQPTIHFGHTCSQSQVGGFSCWVETIHWLSAPALDPPSEKMHLKLWWYKCGFQPVDLGHPFLSVLYEPTVLFIQDQHTMTLNGCRLIKLCNLKYGWKLERHCFPTFFGLEDLSSSRSSLLKVLRSSMEDGRTKWSSSLIWSSPLAPQMAIFVPPIGYLACWSTYLIENNIISPNQQTPLIWRTFLGQVLTGETHSELWQEAYVGRKAH